MTDPIIDRDAIIEKAAPRIPYALQAIAAALPSIADALLAPIEALHCLKVITAACAHCKRVWPCPTAQAVAAIREAVRA